MHKRSLEPQTSQAPGASILSTSSCVSFSLSLMPLCGLQFFLRTLVVHFLHADCRPTLPVL
jgi:hypothetical protein